MYQSPCSQSFFNRFNTLLLPCSRSSFPRANSQAGTSAVRYIDASEPSRQRYFPAHRYPFLDALLFYPVLMAFSYIAVSQLHVYMGTVRIQDTLKQIPMVAYVDNWVIWSPASDQYHQACFPYGLPGPNPFRHSGSTDVGTL